jgi:hypothetical protein
MYTVTLYYFSCNNNGCKNYPKPFNRDVLHRPLCEDSDKIPEDRTSTYILHLSGFNQIIYVKPIKIKQDRFGKKVHEVYSLVLLFMQSEALTQLPSSLIFTCYKNENGSGLFKIRI